MSSTCSWRVDTGRANHLCPPIPSVSNNEHSEHIDAALQTLRSPAPEPDTARNGSETTALTCIQPLSAWCNHTIVLVNQEQSETGGGESCLRTEVFGWETMQLWEAFLLSTSSKWTLHAIHLRVKAYPLIQPHSQTDSSPAIHHVLCDREVGRNLGTYTFVPR